MVHTAHGHSSTRTSEMTSPTRIDFSALYVADTAEVTQRHKKGASVVYKYGVDIYDERV